MQTGGQCPHVHTSRSRQSRPAPGAKIGMTPRVRAVRVSYDRRTPVSITHGTRLVPRQFRVPEKARVLRVSNRPHAAYRVIPLVAAAIDHRRNAEKTSLPRETSLIGLARRERRFARSRLILSLPPSWSTSGTLPRRRSIHVLISHRLCRGDYRLRPASAFFRLFLAYERKPSEESRRLWPAFRRSKDPKRCPD